MSNSDASLFGRDNIDAKRSYMRKKSAFIVGLISGISAPATIYSHSRYPILEGSDLSRMRRDVRHVGDDFKTVIQREYGQNKNSATAK